VEQRHKNWVGKVKACPRKLVKALIAQVKNRFAQLKSRYGPRYTKAMVGAAFVALFSPIPGSVLVAVALVVAVAEVHRGILPRNGLHKTSAKEIVMSMDCDAILQWDATPGELTNLGTALWRWCNNASGATGNYQYLDNQELADLIAGKLPVSSQPELGRIHFRFRDEQSHDREATIDSLRQEIPDKGVADLLVEGKSWRPINRMSGFCASSRLCAGGSTPGPNSDTGKESFR
jgi:hypothetical protein